MVNLYLVGIHLLNCFPSGSVNIRSAGAQVLCDKVRSKSLRYVWDDLSISSRRFMAVSVSESGDSDEAAFRGFPWVEIVVPA